jgi:mRNA interferase HicA
MKKIELERKLRDLGWWLERQGGRHEVWTNGEMTEAVPRHREIDERLARSIVSNAQANPGKGTRP